jgi:hypothetical protein
MQPGTYNNGKRTTDLKKTDPYISVFMPFEAKMAAKAHLQYRLKRAIEIVDKQLSEKYPGYDSVGLLEKLKRMIATLDYSTKNKSIALFVSAESQKISYLDIIVEEKIIVDESFEVRDILLNKQSQQKYLLLVLSNRNVKLFLGVNEKLTRLMKNSIDNIVFMENDAPERVSNFSDPDERKEILTKKYIRHIDQGLSIILKAYPFPLLLACTVKTKGYFMEISNNVERVVEYIPGNYEDATDTELKILVQPFLIDWQRTKEKDLLVRLGRSINMGNCTTGIHDVLKLVNEKKGRLLIVEKSYRYKGEKREEQDMQTGDVPVTTPVVYTKDLVEDAIEKILENGGDVEFVSEGALNEYNHIALITRY